MKKLAGAIGLVISLFFSLASQADIVYLNNGDQISGEIRKMNSKTLTIKPQYTGKIELKWDDISTLVSDKEITIMLPDRSNIKGKITGLSHGQLELEDGINPSIKLSDISKINPVVNDSYETSGRFNFGGSRTQGNTDNWSIHSDAEYVLKNEWNRFTLGAIYNLGSADGKESANNLRLFGKYDRFIDDHWYGYVNTDFTKDRFQNLDYRIYAGAGLGYQFWDDAIKYLTAEAGPGYTYEAFNEYEDIIKTQVIEENTIVDKFDIKRTESEKRRYATARWSVDFRYWIIKDSLQLFHDHEGLISLQNTNDVLVRTHTGLKSPIYKGLNILTQFDYDYKNKPAEGNNRADYRYTLGVGYTF